MEVVAALLAEVRLRSGRIITVYGVGEACGGVCLLLQPWSVVRRGGPKVPRLRDRRPCPARSALW
ncbi:hypothetical protein Arub01_53740 [Actinomadura rubrobrunea]|uniref:Uncharacterized protein n=1 Tax=Actinomadura rubrobrunea TaxID=115335 RepID=A0A9W6Q242_9ACTN|nr:hypothetical protein Arub01_53740 [Actinomadura rubrobrunea]